MNFPQYASAEQVMRDRAELAIKGIARGRSVIAQTFIDGVIFVAENPSRTLRKTSEIYDRLGFAAVGKYNEFENLRKAGIQHADLQGYSYDRADVTGWSLANAYANALGTAFTEHTKPYEVELCVAEVNRISEPNDSQLYRISYDGSITEEQNFLVMGGKSESILDYLGTNFSAEASLQQALSTAVAAFAASAVEISEKDGNSEKDSDTVTLTGNPINSELLEVSVLDRNRPRRAFLRLTNEVISGLLFDGNKNGQHPTTQS